MFLRSASFVLFFITALLVSHPTALSQPAADTSDTSDFFTEWSVSSAEGLDAILLLGAISGDTLQASIYGDEIAFIREQLSSEALEAAARIDQTIRVENEGLTGPSLSYFFSAGPFETLEDVLASARDPDRFIAPNLDLLISWPEGRYEETLVIMPDVITVLEAFQAMDFGRWYQESYGDLIAQGIRQTRQAVEPHDVIPEQARLLGRELDPLIEIRILAFSQPYGIRIAGQRFLAHYSYPAGIQLRVAAHEIFHPPYDVEDEALFTSLRELSEDPWMRSVVENHNPAFGYNSFEGLLNEGSTQALDQFVSERLGFAIDPGSRWGQHDGGMHMLAAALYHAMREDGFDQTGGRYEDWLHSAIARGWMTPEEVRRRARAVVGDAPVDHWYDVMED